MGALPVAGAMATVKIAAANYDLSHPQTKRLPKKNTDDGNYRS